MSSEACECNPAQEARGGHVVIGCLADYGGGRCPEARTAPQHACDHLRGPSATSGPVTGRGTAFAGRSRRHLPGGLAVARACRRHLGCSAGTGRCVTVQAGQTALLTSLLVTEAIYAGHAAVDTNGDRGWLLGHIKPADDARHSNDVEIK